MNGQDVLAIAQTGTGKTASFAIPILDLVVRNKGRSKGIYALILAPTHELARQIHQTFISLGKGMDAFAVCIYGGLDQKKQIRQLKLGASILIATPASSRTKIFKQVILINPWLNKSNILPGVAINIDAPNFNCLICFF